MLSDFVHIPNSLRCIYILLQLKQNFFLGCCSSQYEVADNPPLGRVLVLQNHAYHASAKVDRGGIVCLEPPKIHVEPLLGRISSTCCLQCRQMVQFYPVGSIMLYLLRSERLASDPGRSGNMTIHSRIDSRDVPEELDMFATKDRKQERDFNRR